jgi:hypothetical protein
VVSVPALAISVDRPSIAAVTTGASSFDRAEFKRRVALPYRHRQVFAARGLDRGIALHQMQNSLSAYEDEDGFDEGKGTLHTACVMYGIALALVLGDSAWRDFQIPDLLRTMGEYPGDSTVGNPWGADAKALASVGASFFVCSKALNDVAGLIAHALPGSLNQAAVYARLRSALIADALVVPAGVAALNALQEAHFTFVQATNS